MVVLRIYLLLAVAMVGYKVFQLGFDG